MWAAGATSNDADILPAPLAMIRQIGEREEPSSRNLYPAGAFL
jgi:hypothetical protein